MSEYINMNDYEVNETLADGDLIEVYQPSSGGARREKKIKVEDLRDSPLDAGAELSLNTGATFAFPITIIRASDDQVRIACPWQRIPKQGTGLSITLPASGMKIFGNGVSLSITSDMTTSNLEIVGNFVLFRLNKVAAFSSVVAGEVYFIWVSGTGGKFVIT